MILERPPPAPSQETAQNATATLLGVTQAKPLTRLSEAKQTIMDRVSVLMDVLMKHELKNVLEKLTNIKRRVRIY